jgi:hypothetical protein
MGLGLVSCVLLIGAALAQQPSPDNPQGILHTGDTASPPSETGAMVDAAPNPETPRAESDVLLKNEERIMDLSHKVRMEENRLKQLRQAEQTIRSLDATTPTLTSTLPPPPTPNEAVQSGVTQSLQPQALEVDPIVPMVQAPRDQAGQTFTGALGAGTPLPDEPVAPAGGVSGAMAPPTQPGLGDFPMKVNRLFGVLDAATPAPETFHLTATEAAAQNQEPMAVSAKSGISVFDISDASNSASTSSTKGGSSDVVSSSTESSALFQSLPPPEEGPGAPPPPASQPSSIGSSPVLSSIGSCMSSGSA